MLFCWPRDVGHSGVSRDRVYIIMRHVETTDCLWDPIDLYHKIASHISARVQTQPKDYMIASREEVALEAVTMARKR